MADGSSARTQRRNAQRQRTMGGHPSMYALPFERPPLAGQQAHFPGMGSTYAEPGPSEQQSLPFKGPGIRVGPKPDSWGTKGLGKYYNRNNSQNQFNKPAIQNAARDVSNAYAQSLHFRRVGMHEALRHTFGIEPLPSHYNDYMSARQRMNLQSQYPQPVQIQHQTWQGWDQGGQVG